MMHLNVFQISCLVVLVFSGAVHADEYLQEAQVSCERDQDMLSCGKYRLLRYLDTTSSSTVLETNTTYPVQLVKINDPDEDGSFFTEESRSLASEGEFGKMLKFLQQRADRFLRTQGITVPLPTGFRVIDDDQENVEEARKVGKKQQGLISLLTLFGVFKIKVMVALALLGIFFIKKVFFIGALILPGILHSLKAKCAHVLPTHVGHSGHGEEYHDEYYGNYGHSGYNKDWERRYRAAAIQGAQGVLKTVTM